MTLEMVDSQVIVRVLLPIFGAILAAMPERSIGRLGQVGRLLRSAIQVRISRTIMAKRERWSEADVDALPSGEHDFFERKGPGFLTNSGFREDIAKAVSALANSAGGYLLIGVDDNGGLPGVDRMKSPRESVREWLEKIVPQSVRPTLTDFRVHEVEPSVGSRIGAGKVIIVIDIADSLNAPHQAEPQLIYYCRQGGRSVPAPHHYLEALRARFVGPVLNPTCVGMTLRRASGDKIDAQLTFNVRNDGTVAAYRWAVVVSLSGIPETRQQDAVIVDLGRPGITIPDDPTILPSLSKTVSQGIRLRARPEGDTLADLEDDLRALLGSASVVFRAVSETSPGELKTARFTDFVKLDEFARSTRG